MMERQESVRSGTVITLASVLAGLAASSCLQLNEDHCAYNGGDAFCPGSAPMCTMSLGRAKATSDNGCMSDAPDGFAHVQYGLPARFGEPGDEGSDSVWGVLEREAPGCRNEGAELDAVASAYDDVDSKVLAKLDGRSRVRKRSVELDEEVIKRFNASIDDWIDACGGEPSETGAETDPTTDGPATTGGADGGTTGPMPCAGPEDCGEASPICELATGECVRCDAVLDSDAKCAERDPLLPLCVDGSCVACTDENPVACDDQLLLCDGDTHACMPCSEHAQCDSGACELAIGRCFPEDFVAHVDGDGGVDYTSITAAVEAVDDGAHGVIVVHAMDVLAPYTAVAGHRVDGGKTIALLAAPGEEPVIQGTMDDPGLRVVGDGTVLYVDGLRLMNADTQGLVVDGAQAWVDRSHVVDNDDGGILVQGSATLTLRSCFVQGGGSGDPALVLDGDAAASVVYSTLSNSAAVSTPALECSMSSSLTLRNSIVVTEDGLPGEELSCPGSEVTYSVTEALVDGMGNKMVGAFPGDSGAWFVDHSNGDFHLQGEGITDFADVARWQLGDPLTDIDGEPRLIEEGALGHAGADAP